MVDGIAVPMSDNRLHRGPLARPGPSRGDLIPAKVASK